MDNYLLTVIIPTYNRSRMLDESLQMVLPQVRKFAKDVHVYVSDNASTDDTELVVEKYLHDNRDILTYYRQYNNIGGQNNFRHAITAVDSEYVCLIGDDDVVFPTYVETIVGLLKNNPEVGLINYNVLSVNYELEQASVREQNLRDINSVIYKNGRDFIYNHLIAPSLISSNVFKRLPFLCSLTQTPVGTYPGYDWFAALYNSCLQTECIFIGLPMLLQRVPKEQRWIDDAPWFHIYGFGKLFKDMDDAVPGLFNHWKDFCRTKDNGSMNYLLTIVHKNKQKYKERLEAMRPYMCSQEYERKFTLYLNHSENYISFVNSPFSYIYHKCKTIKSIFFYGFSKK